MEPPEPHGGRPPLFTGIVPPAVTTRFWGNHGGTVLRSPSIATATAA